ncbi:MAG: Mrp/NBP35 family ATP-binding protein [Candidatus Hadarchaeia archaeon]
MEKKRESMEEMKKKIEKRMEDIDHTVVVMSGKGGVGKSTFATNLATKLAQDGLEVGILDCDMHGPSVPKITGISYERRPKGDEYSMEPISTDYGLKVMSLGSLLPEKDSPVVWRGPLKMRTIQQFLGNVNWGDLDYLIFDLPPGTGDEPLSIAQLIPDPDGAVIITTPQDVALQTIRRSLKFAEKVDLPILGLVENMSGFVCPNCGEEIDIFTSGGGKSLSEELNLPFLGTIPLDPDIVKSGEEERPIVLDKDSKIAGLFGNIASEIRKSIEEDTS